MDKKKIGFLPYLITFLISSVISALIFFLKYFSSENTFKTIIKGLSDSFTIPGVLLICLAGLIFVKRNGVFDGLGYGMRYAFNSITPQFWLSKDELTGKVQSFSDYKNAKREKEESTTNYSLVFFINGLLFIAVSVIFIIIYNKTV